MGRSVGPYPLSKESVCNTDRESPSPASTLRLEDDDYRRHGRDLPQPVTPGRASERHGDMKAIYQRRAVRAYETAVSRGDVERW